MKALIEILKVQEVKGFINENSIYAENANRYNGSSLISRSYNPKALLIECTLNGNKIKFYSPTVVITETSGFLNHKTMSDNKWFELVKGEITSHKGHQMFDGGSTPNVAICSHDLIIPKIKEGDMLSISYSEKGSSINRVKILNN